jgi:acyl transferase domain-containing protein/thioesterase domain-containing protein/acyl carrier protein
VTAEQQPAATDIAVVGMAGRFPGAADVDELWRRVAAGEDCLIDLDPAALISAGLPASLVNSPTYVRRAGVIDDVEGFDHEFFEIGPRDASVMDPQHRHFLECSWEALESSAIVPERFDGAIGVFGGCGMNTYLINNLLTNGKVLPQLGWFLLRHTGNDKDFFTNNVAYRLNLHGPAINVQTACSTSLVAVHLAMQSLLSFETDLALAGGATIQVPHHQGYEYAEGEILAPDGVCRAFDADSGGTVLTSGVGVVALRRLDDAINDGDPILAVIKGSAVNNDGARKVGFLAPSVDGHADVIREALTVSGLSARDLQLFEAHGTGTAVGDPIEVAAASEAFASWTEDRGFCRITSTKPNIGHLDTAAGVASLIKVVQALRHRTLPPLANHTAPSSLINLDATPFHISASADTWPGGAPRRAGISSLGVGGTNVHVVVEEAPEVDVAQPSLPEQVLCLSGLSVDALDAASVRLADHLEGHPGIELADVSHTLVTGRRPMRHRRVVTATDVGGAIRVLREPDKFRSTTAMVPDEPVRLGFMFPGGGSQYVGMAAGLDSRFEVFHASREQGIDLVRDLRGVDLATVLAPGGDPDALRPPSTQLPAVFITSVALARQWMEFGAIPSLFVGHSLGEYVAAHLAGVMSYEDALSLVVARSVLMERASGTDAAMFAVPLPESELLDILPDALSLAVINTADECVVAGRKSDINVFGAVLEERGVSGTLIPIAAAAHSSLLDSMLDELLDLVSAVTLSAPTIPYLSNLTGTFVTAEEATNPKHWVEHTRSTVRFADCVRTAVGDSPLVLTELGPGQALSSFARRSDPRPLAVIPTLRHPDHDITDTAFTLQAFARQWAAGVDLDLGCFSGDRPRRLRLPTYPFQHKRCWIDPGDVSLSAPERSPVATSETAPSQLDRIDDLDRACLTETWTSAPPPTPEGVERSWVVVGDEGDDMAAAVAAELRRRRLSAAVVVGGTSIAAEDGVSGVVVVAPTGPDEYGNAVERWFVDSTSAVVAMGSAAHDSRMVALVREALPSGGRAERPADAMALGVALVAQREYPSLTTRVIDIDRAASISAIVDDVVGDGPTVVAHRGGARLTPEMQPTPVPLRSDADSPFRTGGTYLVTGGLGGVGHVLAAHLATRHSANLVLVSSASIPEGEDQKHWLATHAYDDPTSRRIRQLRTLTELGTKVAVVVADLADPISVRGALDEAEQALGRIDGAVHAAGQLHDSLIEFAGLEDHEQVLGAKAHGALVLSDELERRGADLLLLVSSTSTTLAPPGQVSYVAANAVLDCLAGRHGNLRVATINFGLWAGVGVASDMARRSRLAIGDGEAVDHPVFSERRRERNGATVLVGRVDASHHWVVDEHRTSDGVAVYPGTGHLHLMISAAQLAGLADVELSDVTLLSPLIVRDGAPVTIRASVSSDGFVEIYADGGTGRHWSLHSQAQAGPMAPGRALRGDVLDEFDALPVTDVDLLGTQRDHMQFGPRWGSIVEARRADGVVMARLALTAEHADETVRWSPHPALVDAATAAGVALAPPSADSMFYVPAGYERVRVVAPLSSEILVRATEAAASTPERVRVDMTVVDLSGNLLLEIDGLELLASSSRAVLQRVDDPPVSLTAPTPTLVELADELGLRPEEGAELVERLLSSEHDRMIGSTISIDELLRRIGGDAEPIDVAPTSEGADSLERALAAMWGDLLGLDDVDPDDDFFDLGGHSLIAIRLMTRIHNELGIRLQLTTIFDAPTVATLSARLREDFPEIDGAFGGGAAESEGSGVAGPGAAATPSGHPTMTRHLVPISTRGTGRPLYVVHGAGGSILFLAGFGRSLSKSRPVYGFQAHGVEGDDVPDPTVESMASRYIAELRAHSPGPYLLGGYSGGGIVALEMVRQLQELGEVVDLVVLFDSPVGRISLRRTVHARYFIRNVLKHGPGVAMPIITSRLQANRLGRYLFFGGRRSVHERSHVLNYEEMLEHGFHDLFDHFSTVVERYQVGTYGVKVLLVKAQLRWPLMNEDYGWRAHIDGRLETLVAPGDHESMFHGSNVEAMVAELAPRLEPYG